MSTVNKLVMIVMFFILLSITMPTAAQDAPTGCDITSLQQNIADLYAAFKTVHEGNPTDAAKVLTFLDSAAIVINQVRATCAGLSFSGDKQVVIGPVTIPAGIYRAKATTESYLIVHVDALDGECGVGTRMSSSSLFNISDGQAVAGAEAVFKSENCSALITVENVFKPWTLTFEGIP